MRIRDVDHVGDMSNDQPSTLFKAWLTSTSRLDSTIALRMRHVQALESVIDLRTVTTVQLEAVLAQYRDHAPETRKSLLSSWRVFFGWAQKRGIRADDPTDDIESIRTPVRMPRIAPDDDISRALHRCTDHERAMILLARYGCLRLAELTSLHSSARHDDMIVFRGKGDKERVVYLNEPLFAALATLERMQGHGYYFPGLRTPHMHPQSVNKIITRITGWNPHSLRHAGATAAWRATGDLRAVQEMLGHASLQTTQRYLHLDDMARRRAARGTLITSSRLAA